MTKSYSSFKTQSETVTLSEAQWDLICRHLDVAKNWASVSKKGNQTEAFRLSKCLEIIAKQRSAIS